MALPLPSALVVISVFISAFLLGVGVDYYFLTRRDQPAIRHLLKPASDPDDWGHDVYVVTVRYPAGRQQTLVIVDTDSDIDHGDHADGPITYALDAYVEDVIDDATVTDIQHVQAYQVDPDIDLADR